MPNRIPAALLLVLLAAAAPTSTARAGLTPTAVVSGDEHKDEVHLLSGKVLKGLVVYEDDQIVILRVGTHDKTYQRDEVEKVVSRGSALHKLLDRLNSVRRDDATELLAAADQAEEGGLDGEAELLRLAALIADPENEAVHELLGHKQKSKAWRFKVRGKWKRFEDWPEITGTWKQRFVFHTTHFDVESDLPLPQAIEAALDLERAYRAFYSLLRTELEMKDIEERLAAQIHSDDASYPEPGDGRLGYFSGGDQMLFVLGKQDLPITLAHEVCHQLFYYGTQLSRGSRGEIPAWVNEGLAQYLQFGVSRGSFGMRVVPGTPQLDAFRTQATDDKPFGLTRMLTMQSSDFLGGKTVTLKYAQAYSLVHFMLHASDGKYRDAFFAFLRSAWLGKSSMSHFKDIVDEELDMDIDDFEELWQSYVAEMAGAG